MVELKVVELSKIRPNRLNPRLEINIERLNELATSIRRVGLLEPLILRPTGENYEVVVGERRYRASQQAGLKEVPAVIGPFSDEQVLELNLIENTQREDLTAVEKGNCCKQLLEKYPEKYPSKDSIGRKIGVSASTIKSWLSLTEAPPEIQRLIEPMEKAGIPRKIGKLDYDTALTITTKIEEPKKQVEVAKEIARRPIHGRKARRVISEIAKKPEKSIEEIMNEAYKEPFELAFPAVDKKLIMDGAKTQITRIASPSPGIKTGARVVASISEPHFTDLRIVSVERKRLKFFTEKDARAEGGYTLEEFRRLWTRRHGEWKGDQLVHIIHFERVAG